MKKSLIELRKEIDDLDKKLLEIVSERMSKVAQIGTIKKNANIEIIDHKRKNKVLQKWIAAARDKNIPEDLVENIYKILHDYSIKLEKNK